MGAARGVSRKEAAAGRMADAPASFIPDPVAPAVAPPFRSELRIPARAADRAAILNGARPNEPVQTCPADQIYPASAAAPSGTTPGKDTPGRNAGWPGADPKNWS